MSNEAAKRDRDKYRQKLDNTATEEEAAYERWVEEYGRAASFEDWKRDRND